MNKENTDNFLKDEKVEKIFEDSFAVEITKNYKYKPIPCMPYKNTRKEQRDVFMSFLKEHLGEYRKGEVSKEYVNGIVSLASQLGLIDASEQVVAYKKLNKIDAENENG